MLKILQRYVLKEVLTPTLMAMGILTFLVLARIAFSESEDLGGNLSFGLSMRLLVSILPTLLTITVPISLLIGVLLGIGRLTVDNEIKAFRTHGVNLFPVFLPVVGLGALASLIILYNGLYFAPLMMGRSFQLIDDLMAEEIRSLEPGKFHNLPGMLGSEAVLYFKEKNPETGELKNVYLSIEGGAKPMGVDLNPTDEKAPPLSEKGLKDLVSERLKKVAEKQSEGEEKPSGEGEKTEEKPPGGTEKAVAKPSGDDGPAPAEAAAPGKEKVKESETPLTSTLVLASMGRIQTDLATKRASLSLTSGTIHFMATRDNPTYTIIEFDHSEPEISGYDKVGWSKDVNKREMEWTFTEMNRQVNERAATLKRRDAVNAPKGKKAPKALREIRYIRAKQYARISISLACFAFVLIALPLAIYIRPSGKSAGVSIAFVLLMLYYGFLYFGEHLIRSGVSVLGPVVILLPIALLSGVGGVLLHRVVHR